MPHLCTLTNGSIRCDGQLVLHAPGLAFDAFIKKAYRQLDWDYPKFYKMDRLCQLATVAGRHLLGAGALEGYAPSEIAVVVANAQSTLPTDRQHLATVGDREQYYPSPSIFVYTLPNILVGEWCIQYNIRGQSAFFIQERPDWDFLLGYSQLLLQDEGTKVCLTGWVDYTEQHYEATLHLLQPSFTNHTAS